MKKQFIYFGFFAFVFIITATTFKTYKSAGPPSCSAGEPPNNTTCRECHADFGLNTGTANINFDLGGAENGYELGKTYTISVSVAKNGMKRAGFQSIALQENNNKISPGKINITDVNRMQIVDKNSPHSGGCLEEERVWIEHTYNGISSDANGESKWTYEWKAPNTDVGDITFYLATVETNNDLNETGDYVYTTKKTSRGMPAGITKNTPKITFKIYPSPSNGTLTIETDKIIPTKIILTDLSGTTIRIWNENHLKNTQNKIEISTKDIQVGIYFLTISDMENSSSQKIVIQ